MVSTIFSQIYVYTVGVKHQNKFAANRFDTHVFLNSIQGWMATDIQSAQTIL